MELDSNLTQVATGLQDTDLLARISGGDLVAIETKYDLHCLMQYKNTYRSMQRSKYHWDDSNNKLLQVLTYSEVVSHIESNVENGIYIFRLADLSILY